MITKEELLNKIIKHPSQGYALYYYENGNSIIDVKGLETINSNNKITYNSCFRLASVSKQFIAFGIVRLIKNGYLKYDTNILDIFEDLPSYFENITIKNLLNHTSGIYNYESMHHEECDPQLQDKDILTFLKTTDNTYFEIGSTYKYSNTAYILLGLIITKVTGKTIGEYLKEEIFDKANMVNSYVNYQGITVIPNRAYGHIINDDNELIEKDQYWCSATIGDGGIYSCVNDLKKWIKYLITTPEYQDMKVPNYINEESYNEYGLGIRIIKAKDVPIIYHCGETIGTNTLLLFSEELNICLIFLTNLDFIDTSIIKDNLLKYLNEN